VCAGLALLDLEFGRPRRPVPPCRPPTPEPAVVMAQRVIAISDASWDFTMGQGQLRFWNSYAPRSSTGSASQLPSTGRAWPI